MVKPGFAGIGLVLAAMPAYAAHLQASEAQDHIGEAATVCGTITSAQYAPELRGEPMFLRLGHAYPNQDFTIVILDGEAGTQPPARSLIGRAICVSGHIQRFMGKPQIVVRSPSRIKE